MIQSQFNSFGMEAERRKYKKKLIIIIIRAIEQHSKITIALRLQAKGNKI